MVLRVQKIPQQVIQNDYIYIERVSNKQLFLNLENFLLKKPKYQKNKQNKLDQRFQMHTILKKIKKLDQFSEQFNFFIQKRSKQKQTLAGGIFSLTICIVSMCYLGYLLFLYFGNRLLPKITTQTYISTSYQELKTNVNMFGFSLMLPGGITLDQLQQKTGKQYITFLLQHSVYQQNQMVRTQIPIYNCQDPMFLGLLCIDLQNQSDSIKTLFQNPTDLSQSFYHLTVSPCQGLSNCATPQEIYDLIFQDSVAFIIKIKINQFNYITQQFEETYKFDYLQFDDSLSIQVQYVLRQSKNIINQGLIFQNTDTIYNVQNFQRITTYFISISH
ncbi:transmembrane protein, putative (macronuclear) [Tetrahymena thermophila SB210]|uniref:Transmembrane protein, putative n=1 Tax=Tetrahymena thermophila (strain SB210) TaxID=312017 RepID=W7XDP5_TETTS|nr:transmembrane protein, putative [Tetrahymena thermophila SB210]EWS75707.1 transmembrane protein, putative [Tetrahymena thermophila SB210]|eukprot:XP_012651780.1 transmembrane protein, putative [Tetrahymena thermophila SB210]